MRAGLLGLVFLVGCVTQQEVEAVKAERDGLRAKVGSLQDDLDVSKGRIKELEKELNEAREKRPTGPPEAQIAAAYSELRLSKGDKLVAVMKTNMGEIPCELFPHLAPSTVLNFVALAEGTKEWIDPASGEKTTQPLYNGTKFHRVIKNFMVQGGDPLGTGRGGPGFTFPDEVWPNVRFDRPGILAMANAGPNTNGSQFFITDGKPVHLNMKHTIFGLCDLEVVRKIVDVEVGGPERSTPVKDVVIEKMSIERRPAG
jgi:peptidyl-prolyl cis-trans isomerase A (cyclophilin A)